MSDQVEWWALALCRALPKGAGEPVGGRGTAPHRLTQAEAGALLAGCSEPTTAVTLWCFGFDFMRRASYYAVVAEACGQWDRYRREYAAIQSTDELRELAALVFDEIRLPERARTKSRRARFMGVSLKVWNRRFERPHRRLAGAVDEWLSAGESAIRRNARRAAKK